MPNKILKYGEMCPVHHSPDCCGRVSLRPKEITQETARELLEAVIFAMKRLGFSGGTLPIGSDLELYKTLNTVISKAKKEGLS